MISSVTFRTVCQINDCNKPAQSPVSLWTSLAGSKAQITKGHVRGRWEIFFVLLFRRFWLYHWTNSGNNEHRDVWGEVHESNLITLTFHVAHYPLECSDIFSNCNYLYTYFQSERIMMFTVQDLQLIYMPYRRRILIKCSVGAHCVKYD